MSARLLGTTSAEVEALRFEALRFEALRFEALRFEALRFEALRFEALRFEALRFEALQRTVDSSGSVVLLEGARTLVGAGERLPAVKSSGTAVLATAGSGEVLAGVVTVLAARRPAVAARRVPFEAACCAAHVHGLSGERPARAHGADRVMLAREIADGVPGALAAAMAAARDAGRAEREPGGATDAGSGQRREVVAEMAGVAGWLGSLVGWGRWLAGLAGWLGSLVGWGRWLAGWLGPLRGQRSKWHGARIGCQFGIRCWPPRRRIRQIWLLMSPMRGRHGPCYSGASEVIR